MPIKGSLFGTLPAFYAARISSASPEPMPYKALDYKVRLGTLSALLILCLRWLAFGPWNWFDSQVVVWVALNKYFIKLSQVDPSVADDANDKIAGIHGTCQPKQTCLNVASMKAVPTIVGCWINESTTVRGRKSN